jgi:hypothetical protein
MPEIKLTGPSMEQRIAARLRNSGEGANPNVHTVHGTGPTRTHTNIHNAAKQNAPRLPDDQQRDNGGGGR